MSVSEWDQEKFPMDFEEFFKSLNGILNKRKEK